MSACLEPTFTGSTRRFNAGSAFPAATGSPRLGAGVMNEIRKGRFYTEPFLRVGSWRRIMFPETGRDVPFTIENYAASESSWPYTTASGVRCSATAAAFTSSGER
jgi:hypothetical protein